MTGTLRRPKSEGLLCWQDFGGGMSGCKTKQLPEKLNGMDMLDMLDMLDM